MCLVTKLGDSALKPSHAIKMTLVVALLSVELTNASKMASVRSHSAGHWAREAHRTVVAPA